MDTINNGVRFINASIETCTDYLKDNVIQIILILGLVYYLKNQAGRTTSPGYTLKEGNEENSLPRNRDQHLLMVRQRQQELANERAKQAAIVRKEKEEKERERKNHAAKKKTTSGDRLGGASEGRTCGYNPMQPWTANSSGYRPARRTVRRG